MSPTLEACYRHLIDFSEEEESLPSIAGGQYFGSYTLTGPQVGAVRLLLWKARELEAQERHLKQARDDAQAFVDTSISYLDPG